MSFGADFCSCWSSSVVHGLLRALLDVGHVCSTGLLPGEEALPEDAAAPAAAPAAAAIVPDPAIVAAVESMGFSSNAGKRAVRLASEFAVVVSGQLCLCLCLCLCMLLLLCLRLCVCLWDAGCGGQQREW